MYIEMVTIGVVIIRAVILETGGQQQSLTIKVRTLVFQQRLNKSIQLV